METECQQQEGPQTSQESGSTRNSTSPTISRTECGVSTIEALEALRSITTPPPEFEIRLSRNYQDSVILGVYSHGTLKAVQYVPNDMMFESKKEIPLSNGGFVESIMVNGATESGFAVVYDRHLNRTIIETRLNANHHRSP